MAMYTKKHKIESFDAMERERDLLQRYFWDSRAGVKPDAVSRQRNPDGDDKAKFSVYGTLLACGGYIVIEFDPGTPSIQYLDDFRQYAKGLPMYEGYSGMVKRAEEELTRILALQIAV
jgi:hypothetical protein